MDYPIQKRVTDLIQRMTLEEKVAQMMNDAPAIERLGIPAYNWWSECLHGVGRAGIATVFPQAIGMAATWNTELIHKVAQVISDEARAKHHEAQHNQQIEPPYFGLTFWSPNINIFRDPRWGRGQETYGEDPYLTARIGVAFIKGLQGDDPDYLKTVATPKHFAVHSGPEETRHHFDAVVSERDLQETYLPAFAACIQEAKAVSVMGAYNRTNGEPCCASSTLLQDILREKWGFQGYVVSDCGAIQDIYKHHQVTGTAEEAAALAVQNGCDLNCGRTYAALLTAVKQGLVKESALDQALTRLFTARFRLGMFDPLERVPYASIPFTINDSPEHRALALQTARESVVLLKNADNFLPLTKNLDKIAVIGPNANDEQVLLANYHGTPSKAVTPLEGIKNLVSQHTEVLYAQGCDILGKPSADYATAIQIAEEANVVIYVGGLSQQLEGEEGQQEGVTPGITSQGDRTDIDLPAGQEDLLKAIYATRTPTVLVLLNGSAVAVNWADQYLPVIIEGWYPGEEGGTALAEVIFGDYNPAGRLPVTFYKAIGDLPPFDNYSMAGRTYRYFEGEPLYGFGYGLSYTTFTYTHLDIAADTQKSEETLHITVGVKNTGMRAGDEVVQLYIRDVEASYPVPIHHLQGFQRIHLQPGEEREVKFELTAKSFTLINDQGERILEPGSFKIMTGGCQPNTQGWNGLSKEIQI
ncbi:MAG: glycoside hydrolase family 3 C-terminal domain-containing protein [Anaerolineae bacterium]|nr:glycoside hydrolase family 3 C-terminal domain-containing protein [Anaerolineae bacterium]